MPRSAEVCRERGYGPAPRLAILERQYAMKQLHWIRRLYSWVRGQEPPLRTLIVEELPDNPMAGIVYLLGVSQKPWSTAFLCPCGCGALVELNLLPEARPSWQVKPYWDGTVSLHPSVNRLIGCRSHFWIKQGLVKWASSRLRG